MDAIRDAATKAFVKAAVDETVALLAKHTADLAAAAERQSNAPTIFVPGLHNVTFIEQCLGNSDDALGHHLFRELHENDLPDLPDDAAPIAKALLGLAKAFLRARRVNINDRDEACPHDPNRAASKKRRRSDLPDTQPLE